MSVTVMVRDDKTGDEDVVKVPDGDYFIIVTSPAYYGLQIHANGTHVITVKGRTPKPVSPRRPDRP